MNLVTDVIMLISGVSLTLAVINLRFWFGRRDRWDFLALAVACFSLAVYAGFERTLVQIDSPAEWGEVAKWAHIPGAAALIAVAWFVTIHLQAGRRWLFWSVVACRVIGLVLNFALTPNINFREVSSIGHINILGESLSYPIGVPNPLTLINHLGISLLVALGLDASIKVWRQGNRHQALVIGGGITAFAAGVLTIVGMAVWSSPGFPFIASFAFFFVIAALAYELNYDINRSTRLSAELSKREAELGEKIEQLRLSADAADVGVWSRKIGENEIHTSRKWNELFGFEASRIVTLDDYKSRIHPEDVEFVVGNFKKMEESGDEFDFEYRIVLPTGEVRWISSFGRAELADGKPSILRGASTDITKRKNAESALSDLSGRLINAQEKERSRLARELHDDLSQSLALVSIKLQSLANKSDEPVHLRQQVTDLTAQIRTLTSDIHRISHELHPAKLGQLGLESALRGFCREIGEAYNLKIDFQAKDVPRQLPSDISLCLYRIAQESLQNSGKHSDAGLVHVEISKRDSELCMIVTDNGEGFDPAEVKFKESLGLVSMRERVRSVNGTLKIDSSPGNGTQITATVPIAD